MNHSINQRVKTFVNEKGIKQIEFAKAISTNGDRVSKWFRNTEKIPSEYVIEIVKQFPDLNARWLLTGEGEMFTGAEPNPEPKLSVYQGSNLYRVMEDINSRANEPVINYNVIDAEKAVRQLIAAVAYKDMELQKINEKYSDLNEKYVAALEELAGKKKAG